MSRRRSPPTRASASGVTGEGRDATWSRQEQSGSRLADVDTDTALREGNVAYEQTFRACLPDLRNGALAGEMLDALRSGLTNPIEVERDVVRAELAKDRPAAPREGLHMTISTHVLDAVRGVPARGVGVRLERDDGTLLAAGVTDGDGRIGDFAGDVEPGIYRLRFDVENYLATATFYPEVLRDVPGARRRCEAPRPVLLKPVLLLDV